MQQQTQKRREELERSLVRNLAQLNLLVSFLASSAEEIGVSAAAEATKDQIQKATTRMNKVILATAKDDPGKAEVIMKMAADELGRASKEAAAAKEATAAAALA